VPLRPFSPGGILSMRCTFLLERGIP
jgi:hypothetical protein